jgi:hypothetical protein
MTRIITELKLIKIANHVFWSLEPALFKRLQGNYFAIFVMNTMLIASDLNESSKDTVYRVIP